MDCGQRFVFVGLLMLQVGTFSPVRGCRDDIQPNPSDGRINVSTCDTQKLVLGWNINQPIYNIDLHYLCINPSGVWLKSGVRQLLNSTLTLRSMTHKLHLIGYKINETFDPNFTTATLASLHVFKSPLQLMLQHLCNPAPLISSVVQEEMRRN
ncbi:hypothetical protein EMCRGX_G015188 [Ephydatia muelleri]